MGLRVLDIGSIKKIALITIKIGEILCHKTEEIGIAQHGLDTQMKQHK